MHDIFISYAFEDQDIVARPLALRLVDYGLDVWYAEFSLKLGDSLSETIDSGLADSLFGAVVLSKSFLAKKWPRRELRGLTTRAIDGLCTIIPIWHEVTKDDIASFSPPLADLLAADTSEGIESIAKRINAVVSENKGVYPSPLARAERLYETGHFQAAVVTAAAHLEEELKRVALLKIGRRYFKSVPLRAYSLGRIMGLLQEKQLLNSENDDRWSFVVRLRNEAAHGNIQPTPEETRWVLDEISTILQLNGSNK